jgi:hypothetical protein
MPGGTKAAVFEASLFPFTNKELEMRTALTVTAIGLIFASPALAASRSDSQSKAAKPEAAPGWIVFEEDFYYPLRFDAAEALHQARIHYRKDEEKEAAEQLDKAVSWLQIAAGHGYPGTSEQLKKAADDLQSLSMDLKGGRVSDGARLDNSIAKAEHALAWWHYFKADKALARNELKWAAEDLDAAARYLQNAASSAHYEYGDGSVTVFKSIEKDGKTTSSTHVYNRDELASQLRSMKIELDKMSGVLKKDAT